MNIEKDGICEGESVPIHCRENGRIVSKYKSASKNGDFLTDEAVAKRDCLHWEEFEKVKSSGLFYKWDMLSNLSFANEVFQKKILQKARNLTDDFADVACIHPMEFDRELYNDNVTRRLSLYIKGSNYEDTKEDLDIFQGIKGKIKETKNGKEVANKDFDGDNLFCFYHPITFLKKLDDAGMFEFNPYLGKDVPKTSCNSSVQISNNPGFVPFENNKYLETDGYSTNFSQVFNYYHSKNYSHEGIDIAVEWQEGIPIKSLINGKVVYSNDQGDWSYGRFIVIQADRKYKGYNIFYLLGHLDRNKDILKVNATVYPGMVVGYVGNTGHCSSGEYDMNGPGYDAVRATGRGRHLHLEVFKSKTLNFRDAFIIEKMKEDKKLEVQYIGAPLVNPFNFEDTYVLGKQEE